ncbi:DUF4845 domain-containing protein [Aquirhabdus parva]|uniref:DUF4845 domain-containing protein n=1 Tax=Aquirhabdus parva TaxID=2283318 RepID=A0A345P638_9GAMM|nr:DUF4845 domain-containing protein [Aquirhabdus parva]AXI02747.1 DUF4845 domain-containing protein [Aquirhabdus parva]
MRGQKGMSYWGIVAILFIAFISVQFTLAVGGVYLDDFTMNKIITERLKAAPTDSNPEALMREFSQQFDMNGIRDVKVSDYLTVTTDGGIEVVKQYEVRKNFIANIDLVIHFKKIFDQKSIQAGN